MLKGLHCLLLFQFLMFLFKYSSPDNENIISIFPFFSLGFIPLKDFKQKADPSSTSQIAMPNCTFKPRAKLRLGSLHDGLNYTDRKLSFTHFAGNSIGHLF